MLVGASLYGPPRYIAVGRLPGCGTQRGAGPTPTAATTLPICDSGGQAPVSAAIPSQCGTPAKLAAMPRGRVRAKLARFCSESSRKIVVLKGEKAPPWEPVEPADSIGA